MNTKSFPPWPHTFLVYIGLDAHTFFIDQEAQTHKSKGKMSVLVEKGSDWSVFLFQLYMCVCSEFFVEFKSDMDIYSPSNANS